MTLYQGEMRQEQYARDGKRATDAHFARGQSMSVVSEVVRQGKFSRYLKISRAMIPTLFMWWNAPNVPTEYSMWASHPGAL